LSSLWGFLLPRSQRFYGVGLAKVPGEEPHISHADIIQWMITGLEILGGFVAATLTGIIGFFSAKLSNQEQKLAKQAEQLATIKQRADDLQGTITRIHDEDLMWKANTDRRLDTIDEKASAAVGVAKEIIKKHQLKSQQRDDDTS
jgi:cell division protein FtsB